MTDTTNLEGTDVAAAIERYVRFWNSGDNELLIRDTWSDDVEYCAPVGVLGGPGALVDFRKQFGEHMRGYEFRLRGEPDVHHDRARVVWELITPDADPFATGTDILVMDDRGRVRGVTTFLDRAPDGVDPHAHH
ncbi:SnoaL-like protein [Rhodococcus sp. SMB37]|uniref:nuclear transport factor 2 family protein n=1 Tax=Rhodococcus sp. SMB37 TaxID=2512213 RepID=UPI0006CF5A77|nr:nuclear transport factor 2 family protein [Rhodococcus sp. SMB37]TCN51194.1 SnoaL-like protein [Rhodococcus sp. SMB37]